MAEGTQRSRSRVATRRRLIEIGRQLFADRGYAQTPIDAVLREGQLTKGGFYHHFAGKRVLFAAVVESVEDEVLAWMSGASSVGGGGFPGLRLACGLYLSACSDPGVRQILLIDAPAVLPGPELEARRRAALQARLTLALEGDEAQAELMAPLLLGALHAAVHPFPRGLDLKQKWERLQRSLTFLLEGLRLVHLQGVVPSLPGPSDWEQDPWTVWKTRAAATRRSFDP